MQKNNKYIGQIEIENIANDFRIGKYTEGLLAIESDARTLQNILNKPFRSKHYAIGLVTRGKIRIKVNMFDYELMTNSFLTISASAIKEFTFVEENSLLKMILFTEQYIMNAPINQTFRDAFNLHTTQTHYFSEIGTADFSDTTLLFDILKRSLQTEENLPSSTLLFFTILNKISEFVQQKERTKQTKNRKSELVINFFRLLPEHIYQHRDVDFYAGELNINPRYLSKTLKEKTGKTALVLIGEMVIQEAQVLLSKHQTSINEIGLKLGFPDQFTFSKYFKQRTGMSPSEYRLQ